MTVRVALAGCGAWGRNLLRVLLASPRARLVAVADPSPARRAVAASLAPGAAVVPSLDDALARGVDAVLIAAPPHAHAGLVLHALSAGADVFVEKPLATRTADAERCTARAASLGRVAMVGHLLRFHPAVEHLLQLAQAGALGRLLAFESARLSVAPVTMGGSRAMRRSAPHRAPPPIPPEDRSASATWTLGPHDFAVLHALDPGPIRALSAHSGPGGDPVLVEAELASGLAARIALSRAAAVKERRLRVVGSSLSAVFDDVRAPDRLLVGDAEIAVPWREPLAVEIDHFLHCCEHRARPRTPFEEGLTVVRALALVEQRCAAAAPEAAAEPRA